MNLYLNQVYEYLHENAKELIDQYLQRDRQNKGWICPLCGNGSGEDGDGLVYNPNAKTPGHFHCFKCGFDGDLVDLIGEQYQLSDNRERLEMTCQTFNVTLETTSRHPQLDLSSKCTRSTEKTSSFSSEQDQPTREERVIYALKKSLSKDFNDLNPLHKKAYSQLNSYEATRYIKSRGISENNPLKSLMGYLENIYVGGLEFKSCLAFFSSSESYAVRDLNPDIDGDKRVRKPSRAIDIPFGLLDVIKSKDKILEGTQTLEPVFIVEGFFDALSIAEAGADAISLNGDYNIRPVIWAFKEFGVKRPLIILLDNDDGGDKGVKYLLKELQQTDLKYSVVQFCPRGSDLNDYLLSDREEFIEKVSLHKYFFVNEFIDSLNWAYKDKLIAQLQENVKEGIKTGFNVLDGKNFLDGGLYPGLYILGALSSLGKTTFALQLADQIAAAGQDVIFLTLEMPKTELMIKSVSRYTLTDLFKSGAVVPGGSVNNRAKSYLDIYRGYAKDDSGVMKKALNAYFKDTGNRLRIIEGNGDIDADTVRAVVEEHLKITGRTPVVFIDYLQLLVQPKDEKGNRPNRTDKQIVDANIFRLKQISRDFNTPIFGISSFNRDNYNKTVSMKSFKELGAVEYSSDVLIGLEPDYMNAKNEESKKNKRQEYKRKESDKGIRSLRLVLLKNRKGKTGGADLFDYYPEYNCYIEKGAETPSKFNFNFQ